MDKYVISPATVYDEDFEAFGTKIGLNKPKMPLLYTAWGATAEESEKNAKELVKKLTDN